MRWTGSV